MNRLSFRIIFLILPSFLFSCNEKLKADENRVGKSPSEGIEFVSLGNGTAHIYLLIKEDNTFKFQMTILAQPMQEDERDESFESDGTWQKLNERTRLDFNNKKIDVSALFNVRNTNNSEVKIINSHSVELNLEKEEIMIWGIPCERKN